MIIGFGLVITGMLVGVLSLLEGWTAGEWLQWVLYAVGLIVAMVEVWRVLRQ